MPASLYPPSSALSLGNLELIMEPNVNANGISQQNQLLNQQNTLNSATDDSRAAEQIALQLALLQQGSGSGLANGLQNGTGSQPSLHDMHISGSLEDLKSSTQRRSQNMTECVPVPSSEHVAEIVGRQGCKIKALRAKTNTYIKTPVRGEEPVFVVTGRKEDVALAKREILSAADHFSQIRASRKSNINSTLAFGQLVANTPGQTTVQVRVPYRVVGLVVGPKGATIKRIQQQTHTYIVTPSRDKEPVFEVTGLPENVDAARKEIEAHIALRTGSTGNDGGSQNGGAGFYNLNDMNGAGGSNDDVFTTCFSSSANNLDQMGSNGGGNGDGNKFNSILSSDSPYASFTGVPSGSNKPMTLQNLLDSNTFDMGGPSGSNGGSSANGGPRNMWSNGTESHDSGIGSSPPFENGMKGGSNAPGGPIGSGGNRGIWGELSKALGGLDLNGGMQPNGGGLDGPCHPQQNGDMKPFTTIGARSSLDLGTLGRPLTSAAIGGELSSTCSTTSSMGNGVAGPNHTANHMSHLHQQQQQHPLHPHGGGQAVERQMSLPAGAAGLTGNPLDIDDSHVPPPAGLPLFNDILGDSSSATKEEINGVESTPEGTSKGPSVANGSNDLD